MAVHTLRKNIHIRSTELRNTGEEPKHLFNLSSRCDLVALLPGKVNVSRMNTRYVIEVKVMGFKVNMALKEAITTLLRL